MPSEKDDRNQIVKSSTYNSYSEFILGLAREKHKALYNQLPEDSQQEYLTKGHIAATPVVLLISMFLYYFSSCVFAISNPVLGTASVIFSIHTALLSFRLLVAEMGGRLVSDMPQVSDSKTAVTTENPDSTSTLLCQLPPGNTHSSRLAQEVSSAEGEADLTVEPPSTPEAHPVKTDPARKELPPEHAQAVGLR